MATILVGTADGLRLIGGRSDAVELAGQDVTALAPAPGGWWALTGSGRLQRRGEGGWTVVAELRVLRGHCLAVTAGGVLVGTSEAHLLRLEGDRLVPLPGFEHAAGRDTWYTPWGGPPDIRSLSVDPQGTVYANVHVGGILRATDPQGAWTPTIDVDADVHEVRAHGAGVVLAATARGLARSTDHGESWEFVDAGLPAPYARAVALAGDIVLLSASTGPGSRSGGLHRIALRGGMAFAPCAIGAGSFAGNIDSGWLDAAGALAAVATPGGSVWLSADAGGSWEEVATGLPAVRCVRVTD